MGASAERCLGASLDPLEEALDEALGAAGLSLDEKAVNKKVVTGMIREIVSAKSSEQEPAECFGLLNGLIEQDVGEGAEQEIADEDDELASDGEAPAPAAAPKCDQVPSFDFGSEGDKKKKRKGSSA